MFISWIPIKPPTLVWPSTLPSAKLFLMLAFWLIPIKPPTFLDAFTFKEEEQLSITVVLLTLPIKPPVELKLFKDVPSLATVPLFNLILVKVIFSATLAKPPK